MIYALKIARQVIIYFFGQKWWPEKSLDTYSCVKINKNIENNFALRKRSS